MQGRQRQRDAHGESVADLCAMLQGICPSVTKSQLNASLARIPATRTLSTTEATKRIATLAKLFGAPPADIIKASARSAAMLASLPATIDAKLTSGAQVFGMERATFAKLALKKPVLLSLTSARLASIVEGTSADLGIPIERYSRMLIKHPTLATIRPERVEANLAMLSRELGVAIPDIILASQRQPQILYQKPSTLIANITSTAKHLNTPLDTYMRAGLKQPGLFYLPTETLTAKIHGIADTLHIAQSEATTLVMGYPALICPATQTLKQRIIDNANALEVPVATYRNACRSRPALALLKPSNITAKGQALQILAEELDEPYSHQSILKDFPQAFIYSVERVTAMTEVVRRGLRRRNLKSLLVMPRRLIDADLGKVVATVLLSLFLPVWAWAACSSPTGAEGSLNYDYSTHAFRFCDNTDTWVLVGTGSGAGTVTGTGSATAVAYWNGSSALSYDTDGFYWDATNNRLGLGTSAPVATLHVRGTTDSNLEVGPVAGSGVRMMAINDARSAYSELRLQGGPVTFHGNGVENMRLHPTLGYLGVGTQSPTATVQISGTFTVSLSTQTTTPTLYANSSGNVGIGTTTPARKLTVDAGGSVDGIQISGTNGPYLSISSTTGYGHVGVAAATGYFDGASLPNDFVMEAQTGNLVLGAKASTGPAVVLAAGTSGVTSNERMRITSSATIGIGTQSPTASLQVSGTFAVSLSTQTTTPTLFVSNSGTVGIGTSTPFRPLTVDTSANAAYTAAVLSLNAGATVGQSGGYLAGVTSSTTTVDQRLGGYFFGVANSTEFYAPAGITGYSAEAWSPTARGMYLAFETTVSGSTTRSEKMRIGGTGNVGISNTSPIAKLDVWGSVSASDAIQVGQSNFSCISAISGSIRYNTTSDTLQVCTGSGWKSLVSGTTSGGTLTGTGSATAVAYWSSASGLTYDSDGFYWDATNNRLGLATNNPMATLQVSGTFTVSLSTQVTTPTLYANSSGNVGIGTSSPQRLLHLYGSTDSVLQLSSALSGATSTDGLYIGVNTNGTDTTVWNYENGYMRFGTNNAERIRIDSSGNVGVGISAPQTKLHVVAGADSTQILWGGIFNNQANANATGYGVGLRLQNSDIATGNNEPNKWAGIAAVAGAGFSNQTDLALYSGNYNSGANTTSSPTERVRIAGTSGNVGIGTSTPDTPLQVAASGPTQGILSHLYNSSGTAGAYEQFTQAGVADWAIGAKGSTTSFVINYGKNVAAAGSDLLTVTSAGNVGIGTTAPATELTVAASANSPTIGIYYSGTAAAGNKGILHFYHKRSSDSTQESLAYIQGVAEDNQSTGGLRFVTRANADVEVMRMTSTGRVGVGMSSPIATLNVSGTISATNVIQVSDSTLSCASSVKGAMKFGNTSDTLQICTGSGWKSLISGTTSGAGLSSCRACMYKCNGFDVYNSCTGYSWACTAYSSGNTQQTTTWTDTTFTALTKGVAIQCQ